MSSTVESMSETELFTERTPRVVKAAKLHRAAARRKMGAFLAEGENSVEAAVATGSATDLFLTEAAAERFEPIVRSAKYLNIYTHLITERAAKHLSDTVHTTGIFAVCKPVLWSVDKALAGRPQLVSVPVETNDPGNAGTLIRVADAMGADACIFAGESVDPQSPKAVRSTAGSLFHLPVARHTGIKDVLGRLRAHGLQIVATSADGEVSLDHAGDLLSKPTAWLFGNEAHGLGEELLAEADVRVRIPIRGRAESLNLATAASICLYESAKALSSGDDGDDRAALDPLV
ncbi:RNA methyltransferase [Corynebacterium sp. zg254]|uniref:RNA methyltransferase n=2 Tax=Corynebacteriaceae TaxID=1653 RepID=A0ABQ6VDI7_9CORY|nr:RNA methyltransferase [Corynebacterium zhongnanshanii]MCR5914354.1 RNA methyltransferase [Corynebacterium sp. zg254]